MKMAERITRVTIIAMEVFCIALLCGYGTATATEYVDAAKEERFNSSWQANVGGHDATVLVQGSAAAGGETSGDAFVFLDGMTIVLSAVPPDGETPAADAYSKFFRSKNVSDFLARLAISLG